VGLYFNPLTATAEHVNPLTPTIVIRVQL